MVDKSKKTYEVEVVTKVNEKSKKEVAKQLDLFISENSKVQKEIVKQAEKTAKKLEAIEKKKTRVVKRESRKRKEIAKRETVAYGETFGPYRTGILSEHNKQQIMYSNLFRANVKASSPSQKVVDYLKQGGRLNYNTQSMINNFGRDFVQKLYDSIFKAVPKLGNLSSSTRNYVAQSNLNPYNVTVDPRVQRQRDLEATFGGDAYSSFVANRNERFASKLQSLMAPGEEILKNFSRRMETYFSYRMLNMFTSSVEAAVSSVTKLESAFANIQAITASTNLQMEKIRDTIFEVGSSTRFSNEEISKATVILGQAGLSVKEIDSVLRSTAELASATGSGLEETANLLTSALSIWNLSADQASHVADVMVSSANETKATLDTLSYGIQYAGSSLSDLGVSFEETAAVMSAATNAGIKSSSMIGTGMRALATELTAQSSRMTKMLERLGLSFEDVDIQSLGLVKVLKNLRDAGFDATAAFEGFDRRAATFALAAVSQLDKAEELQEVYLEQGAAAKANATQMNTLESQLISLQDIISQGLDKAWRPLSSVLTTLLKGVNGFLNALSGLPARFLATATTAFGLYTAVKKLYDVFVKLRTFVLVKNSIGWIAKQFELVSVSALKAQMATASFYKGLAMGALRFGVIGAAVTALGLLIDKFIYQAESVEDRIANLNDEMESHKSKVSSVQRTYEELQKKEKVYSEDVEELNKRIAELNRQYGDDGFVVKYAEANENLADKLKEVRSELERISDLERERAAKSSFKASDLEVGSLSEKLYENPLINRLSTAINGFFTLGDDDYEDIRAINEILDSSDKDKYVKARNKVSDISSRYRSVMSGRESEDEIENDIEEFESLFNKYISAHFKRASAKIEEESAIALSSMKDKDIESSVKQIKEDAMTKVADIIANTGQITVEELEGIFDSVNKATESEKERIKSISENFEKEGGDLKRSDFGKEIENMKQSLIDMISNISRAIKTEGYDLSKEVQLFLNQNILSGITSPSYRAKIAQENAKLLAKPEKPVTSDLGKGKLAAFQTRISQAGLSFKGVEQSIKRQKADYSEQGLTSRSAYYDEFLATPLRKLAEQKRAIEEMKILEDMKKSYAKDIRLGDSGSFEAIQGEDASAYIQRAADAMNKLREDQKQAEEEYGPIINLNPDEVDEQSKKIQESIKKLNDEGLPMFASWAIETKKYVTNIEERFQDLGKTIGESLTNSISDGVTAWAEGTKSIKEAAKDMITSLIKSIAQYLIRLGAMAMTLSALNAIPGMPAFLKSMDAMAGIATATNVASASGKIQNTGTDSKAAGGAVVGGIPNRDSVYTRLMPGEYVMKKSAVDVLGTGFFNNLNNNTLQTMNEVGSLMGDKQVAPSQEPTVLNVWVVSEKDEAKMGPNDVIATITRDMQTGGTTKKLVQTIVAGRKA